MRQLYDNILSFSPKIFSFLYQKLGENKGRSGRILTPDKFDLTFWVPNYGAKFHQN